MAYKGKHTIVGIHITDRLREAVEVQKQLTAFGKQIKTRLGLHEVGDDVVGLNGILLLEMVGPDSGVEQLMANLNAVPGVEVKRMEFDHA